MDDETVERMSELTRLREENARLKRQIELNRTAHDYLVRLAHHFSGDEVVFESPEQIRAFCERMRHSIAILVNEFKELLSGRRRFQDEFNLHAAPRRTETGPGTKLIRLGDLHGDLGRFMFEWKSTSADKDAFEKLKTAIDELKYHQMALLSGYKQSLKEGTIQALRTVSPETIELEFSHKNGGGLWGRLNPFRGGGMWREYKRRYTELVSEDIGWFQSRFLPSFCNGYREYMWSRKASQARSQEEET